MFWTATHRQCSKEITISGSKYNIAERSRRSSISEAQTPQYLVNEDVVHSQTEGLLLPPMPVSPQAELSFQLVPSSCRMYGHCSVAPQHPDYQIQLLSMAQRSSTLAHPLYSSISQAHVLFNAICLSPAFLTSLNILLYLSYQGTRVIPTHFLFSIFSQSFIYVPPPFSILPSFWFSGFKG